MKTLKDLVKADMKRPWECHVRGQEDFTYWVRFQMGMKLIFGARVHYHFCNIFSLSFLSDQSFSGIEHLKSHANIVICMGEPPLTETHKLDPKTHGELTQIKVIKTVAKVQ